MSFAIAQDCSMMVMLPQLSSSLYVNPDNLKEVITFVPAERVSLNL